MQNGFFLVNKQSDWTSRDVCNKISHIFNLKKVGHSGTLDPFAEGLMIVAFGNATKVLTFADGFNKTYLARLVLGKKTSTGDKNGEFIKEETIPSIDKEIINGVFTSFLGEQYQIPPMTSAIHVNGQKLYHLAHKGIEVEREKRKIFIYSLDLLAFDNESIIFKTKVSKGTYIRTLAEDIAQKLGTVGYLDSLQRLKIDDFDIKDSKNVGQLTLNDAHDVSLLLNKCMESVILKDDDVLKAMHGGKLSLKIFAEKKDIFCVLDKENNAIAIYKYNQKGYYECARGLR